MMSLLGNLFISALKAVAPVLVWVLVMASIANHRRDKNQYTSHIGAFILLRLTFAALTAVVALCFPSGINASCQ